MVDRVCTILNLLQQSVDGVAVPAIADSTGLSISSVFRYLRALEKRTFVERDPDTAAFRLGLGFLGLESRGLEALRERVRPWLQQLRDELKETTSLGILDDDGVIYVDIIDSRHDLHLAVVQGSRDPLHSTALGKAIAAELPDDRVREILDRAGMPEHTPTTITTFDAYRDELARVRELGYAVDNRENDADVRSVAVPILTSGLPAAIGLSAPAARFPLDKVGTIAAALRHAADRITANPTTPAPPERPEPRPRDRTQARQVAPEKPEAPARRASSAQGQHGKSATTDEHQSLVTTRVAAKLVGADRTTLVRWWHRGIVAPEFVTPGGHARWRIHSLLRQLEDSLPQRDTSQLSSADGEPGLVRYLNNATEHDRTLEDAATTYELLSGLGEAINEMNQLLRQLAAAMERQADNPTLYDDRRDRVAAGTAKQVAAHIELARERLGSVAAALGEAWEAGSHLGNDR